MLFCIREMSPENPLTVSKSQSVKVREKHTSLNRFPHFSSVLRKSLYGRLKYHHIPAQLSLTMNDTLVVNPFGVLQHVCVPHAVLGFI